MKVKWLIAAVIAGSLAVPVAASAHPLESNLGVFSGQLPELNLLEAEAGRDFFRGSVESEYDKTDNIGFVGFTARPAAGNLSEANSDIAFQGKRAYQGTFPGFRILDISNASKPKEIINYTDCRHPSGQGDVVIYGDIMTRSWDSASSNGMPAGGWPCGDTRVQAGQEGLHVFDVSDPTAPDAEAFIDLPCGSHTASGVPDPANDRLIVYSTPSSGACDGIDIIEIPFGDLAAASYHHFDAAADLIACHDTGVILGDVLKAACAGGEGFAVWSMAAADGGSLIDPALLYTKNIKTSLGKNINTGHSAAFSNDGKTLIFGHEPNGGTSARCQKTGTVLNNVTYPVQTDDMKSFFFFDVAQENCTLHNYNVVPSKKRDILVHGSYQSGIGVVDFTDLENIKEIAYADPKPLNPAAFTIGGDWSSHYYNGLIWQSDITRGLLAWQIRGDALGGTQRLDRLNPQTQEFTTSG
jgi:hypothetical protein